MTRYYKYMIYGLLVISMVITTMSGVQVCAKEVQSGYAQTLTDADAYTLKMNSDYYMVMQGEGYVSYETPEQAGYITIQVKNISLPQTVRFCVMQKSGEILESVSVDPGKADTMEMKSDLSGSPFAALEAGEHYYIGILADNVLAPLTNGNIKVQIGFQEDQNGNDKSEAESIALNTDITRSMDSIYGNDIDYFKFTTARSGVHRLILTNAQSEHSIQYMLREWDSDAVVRDTKNTLMKTYVSPTETISVDANLNTGRTYYLMVKQDGANSIGGYTFRISDIRAASIQLEEMYVLHVGESEVLQPVVTPQDAMNAKELEYSSDNTNVVSVTADGTISAKRAGMAYVWVCTKDGLAKTSCKVYVTPEKVSGLQAKNIKKNSLTLKWKTIPGASGYYIYRKYQNGWKQIAQVVSGHEKTISGLQSGQSYQFRVAAFCSQDGVIVTGQESDNCNTATKPAAGHIKRVKKAGNKKKLGAVSYYYVKVKWKKVSGATKYKIYYRAAGTKKKKLMGIYKGTSVKLVMSWKSGSKTGRFYVVPVKSYQGRDYIGAVSKGRKYKLK